MNLWRKNTCRAIATLGALAILSACADSTVGEVGHDVELLPEAMVLAASDGEYNDGYDPLFTATIRSLDDATALFRDGAATFESSEPFQQVSWMMDAENTENLQFRALYYNGWSDWQDVKITFSEGIMHNALIRLNAPTHELELRGGESIMEAQLEFYDRVLARDQFVHSPDHLEHGEDLSQTMPTAAQLGTMAVAPSSLVISRSQWGAAQPNKICGSPANVYRMAIHHTAVPSNDGGDPAARMRSMQSYHMNNLDWCDIGYHFVVSQSGRIYQGRSRSHHPAAHVVNNNTGNVGISFIADFNSQTPTNTQKNAGADIVRWVHQTHGVPLNRTSIRGHREHAGQSTSCPGNNGIPLIDELISRAQSGGSAPAPAPEPEPAPPTPGGCVPTAHSDAGSSYFKDFPTNRTGYREAMRLYNAGITNGCSASPPMFCPSCSITRGQWAAFVARAARLDVSNPPSTPTFSDVPTSNTFYKYIEALAAAGITQGCGNGSFCINRTLTRAEAATMLQRARGWDPIRPATPTFGDVSPNSTHYAGIETIASRCVTNGCGDGSNFCPADEVNRVHAAIFISRAFNLEGSNPCAEDAPTPAASNPPSADPEPAPSSGFDVSEGGSQDSTANVTVENGGGCATTGQNPTPGALVLLTLAALLGLRRRN